MKRGLVAAALALALGTASWAGEAPRAAQAPALRAWWARLHEPALDLLLADALARSDQTPAQSLDLEVRVTAAYMQARVASVRLQIAEALRELAQEEWQQARERGAATQQEAFLHECEDHERQVKALLSDSVADLAGALDGRTPGRLLARDLNPALREHRLPAPDVAWHAALPGLVLRQRPDVMDAEQALAFSAHTSASEQLRLARYLQALASEIRPEDAQGREDAEGDHLAQVLDHARIEIASRLALLAAAEQRVREEARTLDALERHRQDLQQAARVPAADLMDATREVLLAQDRLAAAVDASGLAWVALQESTGGAGDAGMTELLGAAPPSED